MITEVKTLQMEMAAVMAVTKIIIDLKMTVKLVLVALALVQIV
jgi:hypothetical protein